jgi:ribosome-associated protein
MRNGVGSQSGRESPVASRESPVAGRRSPVASLRDNLRCAQNDTYSHTAVPPYRRTAVPPYRRTALNSRMPDGNDLVVTPQLSIPLSELGYQASRSGGPGGQHVNTSSTRIEVWWDVAGSPSLTPEQRALLLERLGSRLDSTNRLRIVSSTSRSQFRNREDATERLRSVVAAALAVRKKRKATRPSRAAKAARLDAKRRRASTKQRRRAPIQEE